MSVPCPHLSPSNGFWKACFNGGSVKSFFFVLCGVVRCVFLLDTLPVSEGSSMRSRHLLKDFQYNPPCGGWIAPSRKMPRTSNQAFPLRGPASSPQNLSFFYFSSQEDRQDHQGVLATGYSAAAAGPPGSLRKDLMLGANVCRPNSKKNAISGALFCAQYGYFGTPQHRHKI